MNKNKYFNIGINPSGIGVTGVVIKSFNSTYPIMWYIQLNASNPVEAFKCIIAWIEQKTSDFYYKDFEIKNVAIKVVHPSIKKYLDFKATHELIGMLRLYYKEKFCGHVLSDANKTEVLELKNRYKCKKGDRWIDALAILHAHLKEEELDLKVEKYNWKVIDFGNKENKSK